MTYRFDLKAAQSDQTLVALSLDDVRFDVGRKWIFDPAKQQFALSFTDETRTIGELRDDPQVRFYLQIAGQNPHAKTSFANLDYQPIKRDEIKGLLEA